MKVDSEFAKFEKMASGLTAIPHAAIKAKLEAVKEAKGVARKGEATRRRGS